MEIREFCRGQIAHYKIPRYIRFVDALPMTVTGKPQKFRMRDAMIEELSKRYYERFFDFDFKQTKKACISTRAYDGPPSGKQATEIITG